MGNKYTHQSNQQTTFYTIISSMSLYTHLLCTQLNTPPNRWLTTPISKPRDVTVDRQAVSLNIQFILQWRSWISNHPRCDANFNNKSLHSSLSNCSWPPELIDLSVMRIAMYVKPYWALNSYFIEVEWRVYVSVDQTIIGSDNDWSAPSRYLSQCWHIINWALGTQVEYNCIKMKQYSYKDWSWKCHLQNGRNAVSVSMCSSMGIW